MDTLLPHAKHVTYTSEEIIKEFYMNVGGLLGAFRSNHVSKLKFLHFEGVHTWTHFNLMVSTKLYLIFQVSSTSIQYQYYLYTSGIKRYHDLDSFERNFLLNLTFFLHGHLVCSGQPRCEF